MGTDPSRDNDSIAIVILVATGGLSPLPPSPFAFAPFSRAPVSRVRYNTVFAL